MRLRFGNGPGRLSVAVAAATFCVYAMTAARTITFWEGAQYSLLARTLSISNPPGSLLLTLIGRVLGDVPFAWPMAFRLNLIAALIGSTTAAVVTGLGTRVAGEHHGGPGIAGLAGGGVAALMWAFAVTPWTYATQFAPYGLTALFTALILSAFINWWHRAEGLDAVGRAALVALLLGLDVSVHRANAVLLPAVVFGVCLRRPRALVRPRFLAAVAGSFVLGAALQLLYIPIARRQPFLDTSGPRSLAGLWGYLRLEPIGGKFLVSLWPRRADLVHVQLGDLAHFVRVNLGGGAWGCAMGAALIALGFASFARRSPRFALALLGFILTAGCGVVAYLNRPASYFRFLDRHYLAFLLTLMPMLAVGVAMIVERLRVRFGRAVAAAVVILAGVLPCDRSHSRFAETFARDLLEPLAPHALLLTNGDNDSFPLWYLQQVEGVRRDVMVINIPVAYTDPEVRRIWRADPAFAGFVPSDTLVTDLARRCLGQRPVYYAVTVAVPPSIPGISDRLQPEGLVWRVVAPGDERHDTAALEQFVHDRLPRAGLDDPRERLDEGVKPLEMNYAAATFQLATIQLDRGDARGTLATIETLLRHFPASSWPEGWESMNDTIARTRQKAEAELRDQRPSRSALRLSEVDPAERRTK